MDLVLIGTLAAVAAVMLAVPAAIEVAQRMIRESRSKTAHKRAALTPLEQIKSQRTLIVGCVNFPPFVGFERSSDGDKFSGIYAELVADLGVKLEISVVPIAIRASQIVSSLTERRVHAVACVIQSPARAKLGDFVSTKFGVPVIGVVKKGTGASWASSSLRARNIRIAVVIGEVGEEVATTRYGATLANGRLIAFDTEDVPSLFSQVAIGLADIAITTGPRWLTYSGTANPALISQLEVIFLQNPLMLVPCGLLIPGDCLDLKQWLEEECEILWATEKFSNKRKDILDSFAPYITDM